MVKKQSMPENKELVEYKQKLFAEAERLVKEEFPKKVIEFDALLKSPKLSYDRLAEILPDKSLNIPIPDALVRRGKISKKKIVFSQKIAISVWNFQVF